MRRETSIRIMDDTDAPAVHAIHTDCLRKTLRAHYDETQIVAWTTGRTPEGYLRAQQSGERFLVADQDGIVMGFVSWRDGELLSLFVRPVAQRKGLGSALAEAAFDAAEAVGTPISTVKAALGADAFYERFGFKNSVSGSTIKHGIEIPDHRMSR